MAIDHGARVLALVDGFRVEGPASGNQLDFRLMRYGRNEVELPEADPPSQLNEPQYRSTLDLLRMPARAAKAELHWRFAPALLALAFALMAIPLGRSSPRQSRHGALLLAFLAYLVGIFMAILGEQWLADGAIPAALGLWWLLLPLLALGSWAYVRDGRTFWPRRRR